MSARAISGFCRTPVNLAEQQQPRLVRANCRGPTLSAVGSKVKIEGRDVKLVDGAFANAS